MHQSSEVAKRRFTARSFFLRIVGGGAAAGFGAESSLADGWTLANVSLIVLATVLIGWVFSDIFKPVQTPHNRVIRWAWAGLFAVYAISLVIGAFHAKIA